MYMIYIIYKTGVRKNLKTNVKKIKKQEFSLYSNTKVKFISNRDPSELTLKETDLLKRER